MELITFDLPEAACTLALGPCRTSLRLMTLLAVDAAGPDPQGRPARMLRCRPEVAQELLEDLRGLTAVLTVADEDRATVSALAADHVQDALRRTGYWT